MDIDCEGITLKKSDKKYMVMCYFAIILKTEDVISRLDGRRKWCYQVNPSSSVYAHAVLANVLASSCLFLGFRSIILQVSGFGGCNEVLHIGLLVYSIALIHAVREAYCTRDHTSH